ncbi:laccase domain-containing protein [Larkinella punicea]|uniref:Laccase domain-containing protein n=1 Tax=Larkinella punicea TaxID=2315727 RepID=A0A368JLC9_9BACT|nr:laccase domain-containing protein [Larkinella punicea]RCR68342.1 hypothetical protein DUE52_16410 [Larkinella punicea]
MDIIKFDLGLHVHNAVDVSIPQKNYFLKYGEDGIINQKLFFDFLNISENFKDRVVVANAFSTEILHIEDKAYSGYTGNFSNCNKYDGVITQIRRLALFTVFGDCPQLIVVGKKTIALLHASRKTIDDNIIFVFFEKFKKFENAEDIKVAISPYITEKYFTHEYLNLKRGVNWKKHIAIKDNLYLIDLASMIKEDLKSVGINEENFINLKIDTWELSEKSVEKLGCSVSHRYAVTFDRKEGRGGMMVMLK